MNNLKLNSNDKIYKFIFQDKEVRGLWVNIKNSLSESLENRDYPTSINRLLGEMAVAAQMLIANLKIKGTMIVQFQSGKILHSIMASANNENIDDSGNGTFNMRNVAVLSPDFDDDIDKLSFNQLVEGAVFIIGVIPKQGHPYNGMVEIKGDSLAACLEGYFTNSEQIKTSINIFSDEKTLTAAGIMLQELPAAKVSDEEFNHLEILTQTTKADEILNLDCDEMLYRLYNQEKVIIYPSQEIKFLCNCSREKCESIIQMLSQDDIDTMLKDEKGEGINFSCPCGKDYLITPKQIKVLRSKASDKNENFELVKGK